eukprot:1158833-Pelagomonas_calceolata.AAC.2
MDFVVDVKRSSDVWIAKMNVHDVPSKIVRNTEEELRNAVKDVLMDVTAKQYGKQLEDYDAKLQRTWRVRVIEKEQKDEDECPMCLPTWHILNASVTIEWQDSLV